MDARDDWSGEHAVVTGAAQGIGAAISRALARRGTRLSLMGRRLAPLQALAAELGGNAVAVSVDVTDSESIDRGFARARERHGPLSILVNNAGQAESAAFGKTGIELWQRMLAVNLTGTFLCSQQALPDMLARQHGRIVNVASTAGLRGYAYVSAYVAAKHGVVGLTRALALEVAKKGITVNAVCPGYTDTELLQASLAKVVATTGRSLAQARQAFESTNPQGRLVQPDEVAQTVLWLCTAGAAAITGQSLCVAGGEVM